MLLSTSDHHCNFSQTTLPPNPPETSKDLMFREQGVRVNDSEQRLYPAKVSVDTTQSVLPPQLDILIAEDVLVNQLVLGAILNRLGYEADMANNGLEAVEALKAKPYDVILMDLCMPYLDGLEATRIIRETSRSSTRPWIIAVTANAILGDRERCLAAGMNDYVSKPVSIKAIELVLERYQAEVVRKT